MLTVVPEPPNYYLDNVSLEMDVTSDEGLEKRMSLFSKNTFSSFSLYLFLCFQWEGVAMQINRSGGKLKFICVLLLDYCKN